VPSSSVLLIFLAAALLGVTLIPDPYPAAGYLWDWLNGMGVAALAILAFLGWDSGSPTSNIRLRLHRNLASVGCILLVGHALGFIIADPLLLEYLKPKAPAYMIGGLFGAIAVLAITVTSFPTVRRRCYATFANFRLWHRYGVIAVLLLSAWHVVGANYSLSTDAESATASRLALYAAVCVLLPLTAFARRRLARPLPVGRRPASEDAADRDAAWVILVLVVLTLIYAGLKNA
jgi:hypothetical protein